MANDIVNIIKVTKNIEEFKKALLTNEGNVDFNKVRELPKDLSITSGSSSYEENLGENEYSEGTLGWSEWQIQHNMQVLLEKLYSAEKTQAEFVNSIIEETINNPYWEKPVDLEIERIRKSIECKTQGYYNLQKYGYRDWYDWSIAKWGTKWNGYDTIISENENGLIIEFLTANSLPIGVYEELLKDFDFTVAFADREFRGNYVGIITSRNSNFFVEYFDECTDKYTEDECCYLSDKIIGIELEEGEEPYNITTERMEELDKFIEKYTM